MCHLYISETKIKHVGTNYELDPHNEKDWQADNEGLNPDTWTAKLSIFKLLCLFAKVHVCGGMESSRERKREGFTELTKLLGFVKFLRTILKYYH